MSDCDREASIMWKTYPTTAVASSGRGLCLIISPKFILSYLALKTPSKLHNILANQTYEIPNDFRSFDQTQDTLNTGLSINPRYQLGYLEITKNYISEVGHLKEAVQLKYTQKHSFRDKQ